MSDLFISLENLSLACIESMGYPGLGQSDEGQQTSDGCIVLSLLAHIVLLLSFPYVAQYNLVMKFFSQNGLKLFTKSNIGAHELRTKQLLLLNGGAAQPMHHPNMLGQLQVFSFFSRIQQDKNQIET